MAFEKALWQRVKNGSSGYWQRVENKVGKGTPDCHGVDRAGRHAWLELKSEVGWGAHLGTSPEQRIWAMRYTKAGGRVFIFAVSQQVFTLVEASLTLRSDIRGSKNWAQHGVQWQGSPDWEEFDHFVFQRPINTCVSIG